MPVSFQAVTSSLFAQSPRRERGGSWDTGWRSVPNTLIEQPENGEWRCEWRSADGVDYCDVGSGQLLVVPMGCHHRLFKTTMSDEMLSSWAHAQWQWADGRDVAVIDQPMVFSADVAAQIQDIWLQPATAQESICQQAAMLRLLSWIIQEVGEDQPRDERVTRALRHMREYFAQPLTRDELAQVCHCSPTRLNELFAESRLDSPMQVLQQLRLQQASVLLANKALSIAEGCRALWF